MVNLKTGIVIVNQYTVKNAQGAGSRGSTPGQYVTRYMARSSAVQTLAPVRRYDLDAFVTRYMARESAVQQMSAQELHTPNLSRSVNTDAPAARQRAQGGVDRENNPDDHGDDYYQQLVRASIRPQPDTVYSLTKQGLDDPAVELTEQELALYKSTALLKRTFKNAQQLGGIGFAPGVTSMSHEQLRTASAEVQEAFDQGKTVMKTVLSFSHDYLVDRGIVSDDVKIRSRGDYRGNIDELKLRMGIQAGLERMSRTHYDDLKYIGVIQVDTKNVHAHLVMYDDGVGSVMKDGTQRGKILAPARSQLRRGMDSWLDEHSHMAQMSATVQAERHNVASYIKRWAVNSIVKESGLQYVLAKLPEDERLWRASSKHSSMKDAQQRVRSLVTDRLDEPDSPFSQAVSDIEKYAQRRARAEGLTSSEQAALVDKGKNKVIDQAVNGVYAVLSAIPRENRTRVSTPFMQALSMDAHELAEVVHDGYTQSVLVGTDADVAAHHDINVFTMRARMYGSRYEFHTQQRMDYDTAQREWESARRSGMADDASVVMYDHYKQESEYHELCARKYQRIVGFVTTGDNVSWQDKWEDVARRGDEVLKLRALRKDKSVSRMKDERAAEEYGELVYGVSGGRLLCSTGSQGKADKAIFDSIVDTAQQQYAQQLDELRSEVLLRGAVLGLRQQRLFDESDNDPKALLLRPSRISGSTVDISEATTVLDKDAIADDIHTPGASLEIRMVDPDSRTDVRGVDMHDVATELLEDTAVGDNVAYRFARRSAARYDCALKASEYLRRTGQDDSVVASALRDSERACAVARDVERSGGVLRSALTETQLTKRSRRVAALGADGVHDDIAPEFEDSFDPSGKSVGLDDRARVAVTRSIDRDVVLAAHQYIAELSAGAQTQRSKDRSDRETIRRTERVQQMHEGLVED